MINITVDSYFEYFTTILAWIMNNAMWDIIVQTGLVFLPFLGYVINLLLKARGQGADEGNKGELFVVWLEQKSYVALLVIFVTCVPAFDFSLSTLQFNEERMKECGHTVIKPSDTPLSTMSTELGGRTAAMPLWWGLVHTVSKGAIHAAISAIPCKPDLRQIRFDVQHTRIPSPVLRQEILDFVEECYAPARAKIRRQQIEMDEVQARDLDWIGSKLMVNTPGLYDSYRSQIPRKLWPYDANRDAGLPNKGTGGYPNCKQWWTDNDIGLRARLLQQVDPSILTRMGSIFQSDKEYEDTVVRSLVRPENMTVSSGRVYSGYGGSTDFSLTNAAARTGAIAGGAISSLAAFPAFDAMRQSLPMIQAFVIMAIVICLPIVTVMGSYDLKVVSLLSFVLLGTYALSFWWELARWIDSWLLEALYGSDTHSRWNMLGLQNTSDDIIVNFVMGTMFLVLPALWMGAMGWAGFNVGSALNNMASSGSKDTKDAGGKAGQMAQSALGNQAGSDIMSSARK